MRYFGERFKLIRGEMEAMQEAYELQRKKIDALTAELKQLRKANQQLAMQAKLQYATQQDVNAINTRIDQVDKNRKKDRDLILTEFTKLNRKLGQLANAQQAPVAIPEPPEPNEEFIEHTVEKGEFLSAIIVAYNQHLKSKGFKPITTRDILNANPKLKPELIRVGQKIKIPRRKKS
jgi:LysM repeat protein